MYCGRSVDRPPSALPRSTHPSVRPVPNKDGQTSNQIGHRPVANDDLVVVYGKAAGERKKMGDIKESKREWRGQVDSSSWPSAVVRPTLGLGVVPDGDGVLSC